MFTQLTDGWGILLFGMAGIFAVMGVIIITTWVLNRIVKGE